MNTLVVLDTSVIIKWFRQEEVLAEKALALREAYLDGRLDVFLPALAIYELANVLRYKSELSTEEVAQAVESLLDMELEIVAPSGELIRRSVEIARQYDETVYDAVFVALAESLGAPLITADEVLASKMAPLGFVRFLGTSELNEG